MFPIRSRFVFAPLALIGLLWVSPLTGAQNSQIREQAVATTAPGQAEALADVLTGQARVEYQNAGLKIQAQSAPLIDILREVCREIGAELDAPEAIEPVVGTFGFGPVREVLASLLKDLPYELATAGSAEDANAIVRVVVFSKSKDPNERENKGPGAATSTAEPTTEPHVNSVTTGENANAREMVELLGEAKANFVDNEAEAGDPTAELVKAQTGEIFKALEALIKEAATAEGSNANSPQSKQPAAAAVPHPVRRRR
jgi:hypothetical protein